MSKYSIGIDYGSLSARAILIDLSNGAEVATSEFVYPHAVMPRDFFPGITLDKAVALQHPQDYLDALQHTLKELITETDVNIEDIVGLGIDFTSCTILPITQDGTPLCFLDKYKNNPHAYVKLWKHHGGQKEADEITKLAQERKESWLSAYGNKVSSEWLMPKLLEILHKEPELYQETDKFVEAGDWLVWQITGQKVRNSSMSGFKAFWNKREGYPSHEFWGSLQKEFEYVLEDKVAGEVIPTGTKAGEITEYGAKLTGLKPGTAVAAPIIDAHAAMPAAGIVDEGKLLMVIGTSTGHLVLSKEEKNVEGICGSVMDGIIPGYVAYEAGQSCVGDNFAWFIKNCVPERYEIEARECGKNIFQYVTDKAAEFDVGESGIVVLDWWNGNRSPLADFDLSGMILGLTLQTKPEEIFRGIMEATAFGTRAIVDLFLENGVKIDEVYAAGGISRKNPFMMQMYADVLGKDVKITKTTQAGAKGSAIFASVAGGYFATIKEAADVIADKCDLIYHPNKENSEKYRRLYQEYVKLTEYFGKGGNDVMKRLSSFGKGKEDWQP